MAQRPTTPHPAVRYIATGHFDEGAGYDTYRPGGTEDWLVILTRAGGGRIAHADGRIVTRPGDAVLLRPGALHDYRTDRGAGRWELRWAHFQPHPHWMPWLDWPAIDRLEPAGLRRLRIDEPGAYQRIDESLAEADRWRNAPVPRAEMFALNALERMLLYADAVNPLTSGRPLDDRVQKTLDYLRDRLEKPIDLETLARHVHLSPSRLSHLFREQVGLTPLQYLERLRIDRARQLLELTAHPVQHVARRVGFDNPFYFSLRFKKHTGQSPRHYRDTVQTGVR
jgi:AraC family transcriptional regulator of arabinose operon